MASYEPRFKSSEINAVVEVVSIFAEFCPVIIGTYDVRQSERWVDVKQFET